MPEFIKGLDEDISRELCKSIRNLWIFGKSDRDEDYAPSDDTVFFMGIGMTVCGRRLDEHQKIDGQSCAISRIYDLARQHSLIGVQDILALHKALSADPDEDEPAGVWKKESNGTYVRTGNQNIYSEYALPEDVPCLMQKWLVLLNEYNECSHSKKELAGAYAGLHASFVRVHPFCDGNGRMARLLANLPILRAGFPPILIPEGKRKEYIRMLAEYKRTAGCPHCGSCLLPPNHYLSQFADFCRAVWKESMNLLHKAREQQKARFRLRKFASPTVSG